MPAPMKDVKPATQAAPAKKAAKANNNNKQAEPNVVVVAVEQPAAAPATAATTTTSVAAAPAPVVEDAKVLPAEAKVNELVKLMNNKKDAAVRQEGVAGIAALCGDINVYRAHEAFVVKVGLAALVERFGDKQAGVREAAVAAAETVFKTMSPYVVGVALDVLFASGLTEEAEWRAKEVCLNLIALASKLHPRQFATCLSKVIIATKECLHDIKPTVQAAARAAIEAAFVVVNNRDIEPFLVYLINAMADPAQVPECIHKLASTTFVQTVESPALSAIAPLLVRGLRESATAIRRQCCVIVANMSKLVEDPAEAAPLLPEVLPFLTRAADEISDPEARGVAERGVAQLNKIREASEHTLKRKAGEQDAVNTFVAELCKDAPIAKSPVVLETLGRMVEMMLDCKHIDGPYWVKHVEPVFTAHLGESGAATTERLRLKCVAYVREEEVEAEADDAAEELCNCKFTLAYGTKILLHNTTLRLMRGCRYGLLGGNDSGKSTLLRAIANGQVEGFPPATELRTVFVEADIQGEMSHLACIEYIFADPRIKACNVEREEIAKVMASVGFTDKMQNDMVTTLSGGWRMKLALARAMLQKADILLLDEPTNHLDVINVKWVETYLNSLKSVTSIIVSHNAGLLDNCCTHILQIDRLKLNVFKGNLTEYVKKVPEAKSFFELKTSKFKFSFPQPGFLDGVKSKGKALMKMDNVAFTYPGNTKPTVSGITVQVSLSSRVACVGVNGAGKSTLIKLLTGELEPKEGTVWKHPGTRVAYVAQHAFHHIENHLTKTPTQYLQWRYENGEDKEGLEKVTMKITPEEEAKLKTPIPLDVTNANGDVIKVKRVIAKLTGGRRQAKRGFEYECMFEGCSMDQNMYLSDTKLETLGYAKHMKNVDAKVEARDGMYARPLTQENIETHIENVGLDREFASHYRMSALSGGQKVKVVLAAAMWNQPHILILDEPTNYLDRDSLGALASAIEEYNGGVVMITHNNEFCAKLCPETWVVEAGKLDCKGDPEWMKTAANTKIEFQQIEEMIDASGNTVKLKAKKKLTRKEKLARDKHRKMMRELGEPVSESEDDEDAE